MSEVKSMAWERATSPDGPWEPAKWLPKRVRLKAARPTYDGRPIVVYKYCYRPKVDRVTANPGLDDRAIDTPAELTPVLA